MKAAMKVIVIVGIMLVTAGGARLNAQDPLSAAKDLYASAAYEDALSTLSRLDGAVAPGVARQADEYRAFCLYALGRTREAESIAESIIRREPLARLDAADASPRLQSDVGRHARTAVGVAGLPLNFAVEVEAEVMISG